MNTTVLSIGLTAAVGVAGILSTHLLARSQRKSERARSARQRLDHYRFAQYEARSRLYADYLAEVRTLILSARLRLSTVPNARRMVRDLFSLGLREKAEKVDDEGLRDTLRAVADFYDHDPAFRKEASQRVSEGLPPRLNAFAIIHRLTELRSRIDLIAANDMAQAAQQAHDAAISFVMRLEAAELGDLDEVPPFNDLDDCVARLHEAAIYELRLRPFGEKKSLAELRSMAERGDDPNPHPAAERADAHR